MPEFHRETLVVGDLQPLLLPAALTTCERLYCRRGTKKIITTEETGIPIFLKNVRELLDLTAENGNWDYSLLVSSRCDSPADKVGVRRW